MRTPWLKLVTLLLLVLAVPALARRRKYLLPGDSIKDTPIQRTADRLAGYRCGMGRVAFPPFLPSPQPSIPMCRHYGSLTCCRDDFVRSHIIPALQPFFAESEVEVGMEGYRWPRHIQMPEERGLKVFAQAQTMIDGVSFVGDVAVLEEDDPTAPHTAPVAIDLDPSALAQASAAARTSQQTALQLQTELRQHRKSFLAYLDDPTESRKLNETVRQMVEQPLNHWEWVVSRPCRDIIAKMHCAPCDPLVGVGILGGASLSTCNSIYEACKNDLFALASGADVTLRASVAPDPTRSDFYPHVTSYITETLRLPSDDSSSPEYMLQLAELDAFQTYYQSSEQDATGSSLAQSVSYAPVASTRVSQASLVTKRVPALTPCDPERDLVCAPLWSLVFHDTNDKPLERDTLTTSRLRAAYETCERFRIPITHPLDEVPGLAILVEALVSTQPPASMQAESGIKHSSLADIDASKPHVTPAGDIFFAPSRLVSAPEMLSSLEALHNTATDLDQLDDGVNTARSVWPSKREYTLDGPGAFLTHVSLLALKVVAEQSSRTYEVPQFATAFEVARVPGRAGADVIPSRSVLRKTERERLIDQQRGKIARVTLAQGLARWFHRAIPEWLKWPLSTPYLIFKKFVDPWLPRPYRVRSDGEGTVASMFILVIGVITIAVAEVSILLSLWRTARLMIFRFRLERLRHEAEIRYAMEVEQENAASASASSVLARSGPAESHSLASLQEAEEFLRQHGGSPSFSSVSQTSRSSSSHHPSSSAAITARLLAESNAISLDALVNGEETPETRYLSPAELRELRLAALARIRAEKQQALARVAQDKLAHEKQKESSGIASGSSSSTSQAEKSALAAFASRLGIGLGFNAGVSSEPLINEVNAALLGLAARSQGLDHGEGLGVLAVNQARQIDVPTSSKDSSLPTTDEVNALMTETFGESALRQAEEIVEKRDLAGLTVEQLQRQRANASVIREMRKLDNILRQRLLEMQRLEAGNLGEITSQGVSTEHGSAATGNRTNPVRGDDEEEEEEEEEEHEAISKGVLESRHLLGGAKPRFTAEEVRREIEAQLRAKREQKAQRDEVLLRELEDVATQFRQLFLSESDRAEENQIRVLNTPGFTEQLQQLQRQLEVLNSLKHHYETLSSEQAGGSTTSTTSELVLADQGSLDSTESTSLEDVD